MYEGSIFPFFGGTEARASLAYAMSPACFHSLCVLSNRLVDNMQENHVT